MIEDGYDNAQILSETGQAVGVEKRETMPESLGRILL